MPAGFVHTRGCARGHFTAFTTLLSGVIKWALVRSSDIVQENGLHSVYIYSVSSAISDIAALSVDSVCTACSILLSRILEALRLRHFNDTHGSREHEGRCVLLFFTSSCARAFVKHTSTAAMALFTVASTLACIPLRRRAATEAAPTR